MALVIALAFDRGLLARLLQMRLPQVLGEWSYAIYLGQTAWLLGIRFSSGHAQNAYKGQRQKNAVHFNVVMVMDVQNYIPESKCVSTVNLAFHQTKVNTKFTAKKPGCLQG